MHRTVPTTSMKELHESAQALNAHFCKLYVWSGMKISVCLLLDVIVDESIVVVCWMGGYCVKSHDYYACMIAIRELHMTSD